MTTLKQVYQNQAQKEVTVNENFTATSVAGIFANRGNQNGLSFNYYGGRYQKQNGTQGSISDGTISLNDNATNYVYFNLTNEAVEVSTSSVPLNCFPIAQVVCSSGVISSPPTDLRVLALYANGTPTNLSYTLPIASTTVLGGVKVDGTTVVIDANGVISSTATGGGSSALIAKTTATQASSSTTLANITELFSNVEANSIYEIDCFVIFQSVATTTGLRLGFTSTTGSICNLEIVIPITNTTASSQLRTLFPNSNGGIDYIDNGYITGTGVGAANTNHSARISGLINTGSAGTFNIVFSSEVASSAVTIQIGSILKLKKIS